MSKACDIANVINMLQRTSQSVTGEMGTDQLAVSSGPGCVH